MKLAGQTMHPAHIYGIDFSGAQDAGKKIWIAEGVVKGDSLLIEDCFKARKKYLYQESIRAETAWWVVSTSVISGEGLKIFRIDKKVL